MTEHPRPTAPLPAAKTAPTGTGDATDSFPRLSARTARFTLGRPRSLTVAADGSRVLFVRSPSGTDRAGALWCFDVESATERLIADPRELLSGRGEQLSDDERARRERARETGAGIIAYSVDEAAATAVFALSGALWACDIATGRSRRIPGADAVIDPHIDPTGRRVAYASQRSLYVAELDDDGRAPAALATPDDDDSIWGQAEFIAAEEMGRSRGFWWSPDGRALLVERYDPSPIRRWYLADPAFPEREPRAVRYPAAGTPNARVELWHVRLDGRKTRIEWGTDEFEYLTRVSWTAAGAIATLMTRDQRRTRTYRIDGLAGADTEQIGAGVQLDAPAAERPHEGTPAPVRATALADATDRCWVEIIGGVPELAPDGRLITCINDPGDSTDASAPSTRRLAIDGVAISPIGLQVRAVMSIDGRGIVAAVGTDPTEGHLARIGFDGSVDYLTHGDGVQSGAAGGAVTVVARASLDTVDTPVTVSVAGREVGELASHASDPGFVPAVTLHRVGSRALAAAVVMPRGHVPGSRRLPVIMNPYGGPHAQRVRAAAGMYLQAQWLADQGFAVVIADGRGSPGRGPAFEREIHRRFAEVSLADQVDALAGIAARYPDDIDTDRVGIMGWSYGGYLAALAVLDRPDVFHAAVAGAPVTDWELYDTCYTERFLGDPRTQPDVYAANSLIGRAAALRRPLMIIHGMVDDNVVVAHTLRLSAALLAAGRPHEVLPLTGITHMAADEVVAENLLLAQVDFLRRSLGIAD